MKLYVLVRKDLSRKQQSVQAGHAIAEYLLRVPLFDWDNGTLIYLGVKDENELISWGDKLTDKKINWIGFREPDINNQLTAISTVSDGDIFKSERLL